MPRIAGPVKIEILHLCQICGEPKLATDTILGDYNYDRPGWDWVCQGDCWEVWVTQQRLAALSRGEA